MNNLFNFRVTVAVLLLSGVTLSCARSESGSPLPDVSTVNSPANASYLIEKDWIQLENGHAEWQAAPGSASKVQVAISGKITHGELNYDDNEDAAVFLTYQGGGSGTFYYIGTALVEKGKYLGTNTIWLGDRIGLPTAVVRNGLITVTYLDRRYDESMATAPSLEKTRYFIVNDSTLEEIKTDSDVAVYQGWLTIGHEARSFSPCDENDSLWLQGQSTILAGIIAAYQKTMAGFPPYTPVFTILSGRKTAPPTEGFGADYKEAFSASRLIHVWPKGNCRSDFILLDSPLPGTIVSSPLAIKGRARGPWFFEGDFPLILLDAQGRKIATSYATAKGEWMTENFVDFEGIISFTGSFSGQQGTLILQKDNPTGLTQFDDALKIPVNFQ